MGLLLALDDDLYPLSNLFILQQLGLSPGLHIVVIYNAVRGCLVGPCHGMPLRNCSIKLIWYKGVSWGNREECQPGEGVEADQWTCRQTDRQMRAEKRGHREGQKERVSCGQSMHPTSGAPGINHC